MNKLIEKLRARLDNLDSYIKAGGKTGYDFSYADGVNHTLKEEIAFLEEILSMCPDCGGTETWFDRTILYDSNGEEIEGMKTRCSDCGKALY